MKLNIIIISLVLFSITLPIKLETKIDSLFTDYKNTQECIIGVYSQKEIIYKKGFSVANLD